MHDSLDWDKLEQALARALGRDLAIRSRTPLGGGCIHRAWRLDADGERFFLKCNSAARGTLFEAERKALEALAASGAVRVPRPLAGGVEGDCSWLLLEFIDLQAPGADCAAKLGEQLAALHGTTGDHFGFDGDNFIGLTPQDNTPGQSWPAFFRDRRLAPQLALARRNGAPAALLAAGERLLAETGTLLAGRNPAPALLHGDLWGGNWASDADGEPVIFDPASYYGDPEADLAMTELFGGFDPAFYRAYREHRPPAPGWENRRTLYNLYHVLNHFNLFGGGYADQARRMCETLLA